MNKSGHQEQLELCSNFTCSSLHRQGQARDGRKTRGLSVGIAIAKSSPPPKAANTQQPKAANTIPESTCPSHLSTPAPETSIKFSTVEAACPQPPPFQPPSLSTPYFHHVWQKSLLCFHGCCQELFNIEGLFLQIQSSLKNHQEPPRWVLFSSAFQTKARKGTSGGNYQSELDHLMGPRTTRFEPWQSDIHWLGDVDCM